MMGNLRRTINYMKEGAQNREAARRLPKIRQQKPSMRLVKITLPQYPSQRFRPS